MKPEELRIGNWVCWPKEKQPNEVQWAHGHWLGVFQNNYPFPEPLPLTEEWLMKFGFKKQEDGDDVDDVHWYEITTNGITLVQGDKKGYLDVFLLDHEEGVRVQYVHQLQNLYFALTGEELTVK